MTRKNIPYHNCKKNYKIQKKRRKTFGIIDIQHNDKLVKKYTGLQNAKRFGWIYQFILVKADSLHYYDQKSSQKRQVSRKLNSRKTFLIKLGVGLTHRDLAYRFLISQCTVSVIISLHHLYVGHQEKRIKMLFQNAFKIFQTF